MYNRVLQLSYRLISNSGIALSETCKLIQDQVLHIETIVFANVLSCELSLLNFPEMFIVRANLTRILVSLQKKELFVYFRTNCPNMSRCLRCNYSSCTREMSYPEPRLNVYLNVCASGNFLFLKVRKAGSGCKHLVCLNLRRFVRCRL